MKKLLISLLVLVTIIAGISSGCEEQGPFAPQEQPSNVPVTETTVVTPNTSPEETPTTTAPETTSSTVKEATPIPSPEPSSSTNQEIPTTTSPEISSTSNSGSLIVSILDVGQADCIVIQHGEKTMIVDAGNNADATFVVNQLNNMGIEHLDVVVGTHPHEDHIGGLDAVINNFDIGTIYMPKVSNTTKTFEDVLLAIQNKNLSVTTPVPGTSFTLGDDVQCLILAPNNSTYNDLNNYSIVLKVTFDGRSFLFTGDAEVESETEILAKGFDLNADVLKVGHHGSSSSTSEAFLQVVSPEYAVICCGVDNSYGHPHQETLDKLNSARITTYRTDFNGTIQLIVNDGQLSVTTGK